MDERDGSYRKPIFFLLKVLCVVLYMLLCCIAKVGLGREEIDILVRITSGGGFFLDAGTVLIGYLDVANSCLASGNKAELVLV